VTRDDDDSDDDYNNNNNNNLKYAMVCKYRISETPYTQETWFVLGT